MDLFPVTHSILAQGALASEVLPHYLGDDPASCQLLVRGMNDTYLVRTGNAEYIVRVYRHNHRSLPEIRHELDLLQHLKERGAKVAAPIARTDGQFLTEVSAPEGTRYIALFAYAPGAPRSLTLDIAGRYGHAAAILHRAMESFSSNGQRRQIDVKLLLDDRVPWILPLLDHRLEDQLFVRFLWNFLREQIKLTAPRLRRGLCHGDLNGGNCHIDEEGTVTFFDFDCEGPGWPAYDVAVFNWSVRDMPNREIALQLWQSYLDSYQTERPLSDSELAALPLFVAARQLWLVGLHCQHADEWTYGNLSDAYFDRRLKLLRELAHEQNWPISL